MPLRPLALSVLFASPAALAQLTTPTPPLPPVQLHTPPRIIQMRAPRAEQGSDLNIVPSGTWWRYPETIKDLNLTPDQQHRMEDIFRQNRLQLIDLKASLEKEQINLEPYLNTNPPNTDKAMAEISRIADLRADLEKANARMLLGLRAQLTADQWTRLQVHRPGLSFSYDNGQNRQSRLESLRTSSVATTCNQLFNNSAKDCSITTISTKRENGHTVITTCVSTAAQSTPKCTTTPTGSSHSFELALPWDGTQPAASNETTQFACHSAAQRGPLRLNRWNLAAQFIAASPR